MTHNLLPLSFTFLLIFLPIFPALPDLPDPDPKAIQTITQVPSPPATIPAFPEQSDLAGCPLNLPNELFTGIKSACSDGGTEAYSGSGQLYRSRCCPVLAAWLYSAYSETALQRASGSTAPKTASYDLPLLPDDSETCVDELEKALNNKGVNLVQPNETCDVVFCYCGIRLHPFSCPEAFSVSSRGKLVGDGKVRKLERDCLVNSNSVNGFVGLGGCSNCLNTLYQLNAAKETEKRSTSEDRTSKMHNRDCELMGLTWLLAKNRSAYIHTVSAVLRTLMMSSYDASNRPHSCTLNSDGMPLAVDSSEINNQSSSPALISSLSLFMLLSIWWLYVSISVSSSC